MVSSESISNLMLEILKKPPFQQDVGNITFLSASCWYLSNAAHLRGNL